MSSDVVAPSPTGPEDFRNVEEEAYEPTYAEAFPPLPVPEGDQVQRQPVQRSTWSNKLFLKTSTVTQVFCVPVEERRYKEIKEQGFGESEQAKVCSDIMAKTGVSIEMSSAKDQSLTVVITGKGDAVMRARKMIVQQLQTQAFARINIPKEHYRFLLGPKGQKLNDLQLTTATKITVPRPDENSDVVTITGTKEGIEKARHEIQLISDEQAKLAFERLHILKVYHPFICGPENRFVKELQEQTAARISVPPLSVQKDEIVVAGEKEGVHKAIQAIMKVYEEKKRKCHTISVEVRKSQHKYVIGPRGSNLNEILETTGVSVEVPSTDSNSETITLRGEQDKLGPALTMVYSKANSVVISAVEAPAWLHRFIIGRKGSNIKKITQDFPKVHIEFQDGQDKIELEGPPEDVEACYKALEDYTKDLLSRMAFAEIEVDQKYHKHIIGRQGANVGRIKDETGVSIRIPPDSENSNVIRIEGEPKGVEKAKQELLELVHKMENEKSRDIIIEHRFHKTLIGAQGGKIREIRDKFNQVQITFPDASKKNDVVTLRGPKNDVDKCFRYLQQLHQELISSNYMAEVHVFKQFHKNIIGKGGANIAKIRQETSTRIDLPSEGSESDVISITGKKSDVDLAKQRIEQIQKELANIKEITIEIPHKFHNSIIGAKGRLIRSVMEECGGVIIRFPPEGTASDKVTIRGPKDDVENAKKQLLELANERKEAGFTTEVRAKPEYHKFLIGRGGANIRKVRDQTGARVVFPTAGDADQELITIIGKKESVDKAKIELENLIKNMDNVVEQTVNVEPKFHRHFVVRRGEVLRQIADEYGNVSVSFPRSGVKSDIVTVKGAKDCVEAAKKRILEIVADLEAQITIECIISQKYHRTVMGQKGYKVQEITREFDVNIKFPDRPTEAEANQENEEPTVNGDAGPDLGSETEKLPNKHDIITISGKKENCEGAHDALMALVPIVKEIEVAHDLHRYIIGQRGAVVRQMMDECDVNISVPPELQNSNTIKITGAPANVAKAEEAMASKVKELEALKEERALRSFQLEVTVDPMHHPKIIGRRGAVITKIRQDHDVQIQFPERGSDRIDVILITGLERDANAAKDDILKIVRELEDRISEDVEIDHRVHSRLIGARGRAIRRVMEEYKVDIKFPNAKSDNPNLVQVTGLEDNVFECKDYLLNLEEEYMQDINDQELMKQYFAPHQRQEEDQRPSDQRGFTVRDAPWSDGRHAPDTSSTADFPEFGSTVQKPPAPPIAWGPSRRK